jgi:hypothetical protein
LLVARAGVARAEPLRPVVGKLGWQIDLDAFVQVDAVPYAAASLDEVSPSTGAPLNQQTISVRRGLFRAIAKKDDFRVLLEVDASTASGSPNATVFEAMLGWSPSERVDLEAGLMLIPFGAATPINARYRDFMEQPTFLRAFFPGDRDTGASASGAYGALRWSIAAMNGAPTKDAQWKGADPSSSYDAIGRIGGEIALPSLGGRPRFVAGVSALSGAALHAGTPPTKDRLVWVDENMDGIVQPTELQVIPGQPGTPSQTFHHAALGADASASWCLQWAGEGRAFFEAAIATNLDRAVYYADPITTARDLRELGYMLGVVQHVTRHALVGARYDFYDADRDATAPLGTTLVGVHRQFSTLALLAAGMRGTLRLSVEYDLARNPLGLSTNGVPVTRADDRLIVRAQGEF